MTERLPSMSGERIALRSGDYAAEVVQSGAALRSLARAGRDLVVPFGVDEMRPDMRGAVLQPWPNRIADGRYRFDGHDYELAWTDPHGRTAIHGLAGWLAYSVVERAADQVRLAAPILPQPGYPFALRSEIDYRLGPDGLTVQVGAVNIGEHAAPYGAGVHPYLIAGPGRVDDWTLTLPADTCIVHHPPRYLPGPERPVAGTDTDFAVGRDVGPRHLCHAFHGLPRDSDGWAQALVVGRDGSGVRLRCDAAVDWLMVFTYDLPTGAARTGLAVEPMTCPADAFNSGQNLIVLEPGQRHQLAMHLSAVD